MSDQITNLMIKGIEIVYRGINIRMTNGEIFKIRAEINHTLVFYGSDSDETKIIYADNFIDDKVNFYKDSFIINEYILIGKTIQKTKKINDYSYKFIIDNEEYIISTEEKYNIFLSKKN
jgi:hypothetical protein